MVSRTRILSLCFLLTGLISLCNAAVKEVSEDDLNKERAKKVSPLPEIHADYVFGADLVKPAWEGMTELTLRRDSLAPGQHTMEFDQRQIQVPGKAGYWRLENIQAGDYYLGLWVDTGCESPRTEYYPPKLLTTAFVNGWPVRFSTSTDPVQVKPGLWFAELQGASPVSLKNGDEIAFSAVPRWNVTQHIARLALYRKSPARGHGITGQIIGFDRQNLIVQRLRLVLDAQIAGSGQDGTEHVAKITVRNPLPYAVDALITWKLSDFYGTPVDGKTQTIHLDAHQCQSIERKFQVVGDAIAYQLDVRSKPAPGFKLPFPRPVEMLDLNDFAKMESLPGQIDPLTVWNHVRKELGDNRTGTRRKLLLDGSDWEWAFLDGRSVPAAVPEKLDFKPQTIPYDTSWVKNPPDRFGKWYRKRFQAPDWLRGQRIVIQLDDVEMEGTLFLNGRRIASHTGSGPLVADVTDSIRMGQKNELVICIRDSIALMDQANLEKYTQADISEDNIVVFGRSGDHAACLKHSVWLQTRPEVRVDRNVVLPEVENGKLHVMTRVKNDSDKAHKLTLRFALFQDGKPIDAHLPDQAVTVEKGTSAETAFDAPAGNLATWTPREPVLAKVVVTLLDDGKELDRFEQRFGYRTLKVKGLGMTLNGKPVRLLGDTSRYNLTHLEGSDGVTVSRGWGNGTENVDSFDEVGILTYDWAGLGNCTSWTKINNERWWNSIRNYAVEKIWEIGSHPAMVGMEVSNESFHYATCSSGVDGQNRIGALTASIAQAIQKKFWADYWCFADGDEDLGGRLNFCSFHYINTSSAAMNGLSQRPGETLGYLEGTSSYPPDGFFLNGAARAPTAGTHMPLRPDWVYGTCACGDTEMIWYTDDILGPKLCKFIGDRSVLSTACQFYDPRGMSWTKLAMDGCRDMDMAYFAPIGFPRGFQNLCLEYVTFAMPAQEIRYYSGKRFDRRLNIHDVEFLPGDLEFRWQLRDASGKAMREGKFNVASGTALLDRRRITFDMPEVQQDRTPFTLDMELFKDGIKRAHEQRLIEVWPGDAPVEPRDAPTGEVVVFGSFPVLKHFGVAAKPIKAFDEASLKNAKVLIVGPDIVTKEVAESAQAFNDFVRRGGRVILLHQTGASLLPAEALLENKAYFSQAFVRASDHPVLRGLTDKDFQMWNPGHLITRGAYHKPDKGAFMTLLDSGNDGTLAWTAMIEFYVGKGSILACQLPLVEDFDTEPMAAELLGRMLKYTTEPIFRGEGQRMAVLGEASEALTKRLKDIRADFEPVTAPGAQPVTLIDLGIETKPPAVDALKTYVRNGGTLIVHRVRPEHQEWLAALTDKKVSVEAQLYESWVDREILDRRDGLLTGINNLDLYWRPTVPGWTDDRVEWQVSYGVEKGKSRGQADYVVKVDGVGDYLFPGGLVEVSVGNGRVIIDQLKWEMSEKDLACGSPARYVSMLLTNLGVLRKPPAAKPSLPAGVAYTCIDLSSVANRGLRDDKAGDGLGWVDWGPEQDLRDFPTGQGNFDGVPFLVNKGDKNCIVLRCNDDWVKGLTQYPAAVTIPLNKKNIAGLWFMHTGGWMYGDKPFAWREINYADGSSATIALNNSNCADWNFGHDNFPAEEGTLTTIAWKGSCKAVPITRVYKTLWVNPHPEKEIKEVVLTTRDLPKAEWRFLAHLGLTVATLPPGGMDVTAKRDPAKSQALLQEALKLLADKKPAEASAKLEAALQADDHNDGAWKEFTSLRSQADSVEAFTALCHRWTATMPQNYEAHNVLGRFLEKKGKLPEALSEYRQSLKIEWNQPPIMQAAKDLEEKIK